VGAWFLKAVWTKLTIATFWGVPYPAVAARFIGFQPKRVAEFAAGNPLGWYKHCLDTTVLSHARRFATLQASGQAAAGPGLVLGSRDAAAELRVFVPSEQSDNVTVIHAASGTVIKTIAVEKRPRGIAASADGKRVYVSNGNSDSVTVIDGGALSVVTSAPAGRDPEGVALNRAGTRLYAVNENESVVTVLDAASLAILHRIEVGTEPETAVVSPG